MLWRVINQREAGLPGAARGMQGLNVIMRHTNGPRCTLGKPNSLLWNLSDEPFPSAQNAAAFPFVPFSTGRFSPRCRCCFLKLLFIRSSAPRRRKFERLGSASCVSASRSLRPEEEVSFPPFAVLFLARRSRAEILIETRSLYKTD